jgi:hypothetical protein
VQSGQRAPPPADRRTDGFDDDGTAHGCSLKSRLPQ